MNLSDVKTQSLPESGLPSVRLRPSRATAPWRPQISRYLRPYIFYLLGVQHRCKRGCPAGSDGEAERSCPAKHHAEGNGKRDGEREREKKIEGHTGSARISPRSTANRGETARRKSRGDCTERWRKLQTRKLSEALLSPTRPPSGTKGVVRYTSISKYFAPSPGPASSVSRVISEKQRVGKQILERISFRNACLDKCGEIVHRRY